MRKRHWNIAIGLGAIMLFLYAIELGKISLLVFSHESLPAVVHARREATSYCAIGYRFSQGGQEREETKLYRFPETLFISGMSEGQPIEILASRQLPFLTVPRRLVWFEVLHALVLVGLSAFLIRFARGQKRGSKL